MSQRSIRFPDELEAQIQAKAENLDRSFSWVVLRACEVAIEGVPKAQGRAVMRGMKSVPDARPSHSASSRTPGDPAAAKAKREAPPDRRVKGSTEARPFRPIPKAGKR